MPVVHANKLLTMNGWYISQFGLFSNYTPYNELQRI